jgi:hypothetical protein
MALEQEQSWTSPATKLWLSLWSSANPERQQGRRRAQRPTRWQIRASESKGVGLLCRPLFGLVDAAAPIDALVAPVSVGTQASADDRGRG